MMTNRKLQAVFDQWHQGDNTIVSSEDRTSHARPQSHADNNTTHLPE